MACACVRFTVSVVMWHWQSFEKVLTYEDVGNSPHPLLRHHDPNDDEISARGDRRHQDKEHGPNELSPPREDVRVYVRVCIIVRR